MYDFFRAVCAVPKVKVADTDFNLSEIIKKADEAEKLNPDLIVFGELCLTGYTCQDLFFQKRLLSAAKEALLSLAEKSIGYSAAIAAGLPLEIGGRLYNAAAIIYKGKICGIVPKTYIPNYGEFYEKRWFSSAAELKETSISSAYFGAEELYEIPIGRDLIFRMGDEASFGAELCEDLWAPVPPSSFLALAGAEVIINLSASNETVLKREYRQNLIKNHSAATVSAYVYVSSGREESTQDLVFSGHSVIAESGSLLEENGSLCDSDYILVSDIDLGKIRADRLKMKTFADSANLLCKTPFRYIDIGKKDFYASGEKYRISKLPFVPQDKAERLSRCLGIFRMQAAALAKRLEITGARPVIGISGGLDSTLALLVCAEAMKILGKEPSEIYGITMPCFGTSKRTHTNSLKLMEALGISFKEISIKEACLLHFKDIGHDENELDLTYENSQARERTQVLMDFAGKVGGIVIGTGDLSELALGWCTYNADHMSMYGVNAGVPKTLVKWLICSLIEYNVFPESSEILKDITETPISPELLPPDKSGNISQETESLVGPYPLHDFFLYYVLRFGFEPKKIFHLAQLAFGGEYSKETILKWERNFYKRFFSQQFKRSCLPDGVKIGSVCLSPRGDWRMPSDSSAAVWLKQLDEI